MVHDLYRTLFCMCKMNIWVRNLLLQTTIISSFFRWLEDNFNWKLWAVGIFEDQLSALYRSRDSLCTVDIPCAEVFCFLLHDVCWTFVGSETKLLVINTSFRCQWASLLSFPFDYASLWANNETLLKQMFKYPKYKFQFWHINQYKSSYEMSTFE